MLRIVVVTWFIISGRLIGCSIFIRAIGIACISNGWCATRIVIVVVVFVTLLFVIVAVVVVVCTGAVVIIWWMFLSRRGVLAPTTFF